MDIFDDVWFEKNPKQAFLFDDSTLMKKNCSVSLLHADY